MISGRPWLAGPRPPSAALEVRVPGRAAAAARARHDRAGRPRDARRGPTDFRGRAGRRGDPRAARARCRRRPRRGRGRRGHGRRAEQARLGRRSDAAGPLPGLDHRRSRVRVARARHALSDQIDRRGRPARHGRPGAGRADAARDARAFRDRREGDRPRHGPAHHPLRAPPGARDEGLEGRRAQGRSRLRAGRDRHPDPRADPGQAGGRGGGSQRAPPDRAPR